MRKKFRSEDVQRDGHPGLCPEKPCYSTCRKPCELVERWISQDHVGRNKKDVFQLSVPDMDVFTNEFLDHVNFASRAMVEPDPRVAREAWEKVKRLNLPGVSFEFAKLYYKEGKNLSRVAAELKISSQAADSRHSVLKREVKDRLERLEIWEAIKGEFNPHCQAYSDMIVCLYYHHLMTMTDISHMAGVTYSTVHRIITAFKFDRKIA